MAIIAMTTCIGCADGQFNKPNMLLKDNPLPVRTEQQVIDDAVARRNRKAMYEDVAKRECPLHGAVYRAIMDTRYGG